MGQRKIKVKNSAAVQVLLRRGYNMLHGTAVQYGTHPVCKTFNKTQCYWI